MTRDLFVLKTTCDLWRTANSTPPTILHYMQESDAQSHLITNYYFSVSKRHKAMIACDSQSNNDGHARYAVSNKADRKIGYKLPATTIIWTLFVRINIVSCLLMFNQQFCRNFVIVISARMTNEVLYSVQMEGREFKMLRVVLAQEYFVFRQSHKIKSIAFISKFKPPGVNVNQVLKLGIAIPEPLIRRIRNH